MWQAIITALIVFFFFWVLLPEPKFLKTGEEFKDFENKKG